MIVKKVISCAIIDKKVKMIFTKLVINETLTKKVRGIMEKFTEFWCFRLNVLSRKISRRYNNKCTEFGVTAPQSFVLFDLLDHEGSNVKDIAFRVQLDSSAVTGVIDRLYKDELVKREEDPSDRRSLKIQFTPKGRKLAEDLFPIGREFNMYLRSLLDPEKAEMFEESLNDINDQVE